ncbi:unnamed protein product [Brachionus calyciflorus]|uniref:Lysosomal dipeptide transporter MFSD1 n=1 Tax=Brachionus calyciflorus TaxID=104777 RepID=A0A813MM99_9BILA|nr:unnamed protein product [Brachionus calyciflorus]
MESSTDLYADEQQPLLRSSINDSNEQINQFPLFDPRAKFYRYFSLIFICLLTFGPYFCYVLPGALENEFERDLRISTTQFTIFTSLYSWPNIILCFFGGFLIDRVLGVRLGAILFSCFVTVGQILFAYGAYTRNIWMMYIGRFIFGIGGETVSVAQKAYCVTWFPTKELNLVFGFIASAALLGSSINQIAMNPIYNYINEFKSGYECLGVTIFLASLTAIASTCCAFILSPLDKRRNRILKIVSNKNRMEAKIKISESFKFPIQIWLIIIICIVFYSATFPFISLGKLYFIKKYGSSATSAALQQSLFFFGTVVTSPLFGTIVDSTGYNLYWVIFSIVLALASHIILLFSFVNSFIPVLMMGTSLSLLYASLWPMVSLIVAKNKLGTAYGLMQSFQNLGLAIFNIIAGYLVQNYGYLVLEVFFIYLCIVGLLASIALFFWDKLTGGHLNLSKEERCETTLS